MSRDAIGLLNLYRAQCDITPCLIGRSESAIPRQGTPRRLKKHGNALSLTFKSSHAAYDPEKCMSIELVCYFPPHLTRQQPCPMALKWHIAV